MNTLITVTTSKSITDTATAANGESGTLWDDCPENEAFLFTVGDEAATAAGFAKADHVVKQHIVINRVATVSMEPRGGIGAWDEALGRYTLTAATQGVSLVSKTFAAHVFRTEPENVRVLTHDVGGGFGMKAHPYPEYAAVMFAALVAYSSWISPAFLAAVSAIPAAVSAYLGWFLP